MKTQKLSLFSIILFCLFSCDKKECCTNIDIDINLKVLNQQGQNLLAVPAVYSKSNIEIYHVINGQAQLFDQPNLDADKGFLIINKGSGNEMIRVFPYYNEKEKSSRTLIKLGNTKTDTIKCEFEFPGSSIYLRKVWFNGALKSDQLVVVK